MGSCSFKDVFGFEPASSGTLKVAQQMAIDAKLGNLARLCSGAEATLGDLARALKRIEAPDSASVLAFATMMATIESDVTTAKATFDEAVHLAKEAGFAVLGKVEDTEVRRIFGLETVHKPITNAEVARVDAVLSALAMTFGYAELLERTGGYLPRSPTPEQVNTQNALKDLVMVWKVRFWEAHGLAKKLGVKVATSRGDYLPPALGYWSSMQMKDAVDQAVKDGLISA